MSLYHVFEMQHALLSPWRSYFTMAKSVYDTPGNPLQSAPFAKPVMAGIDLFERATRRYEKPPFGLDQTQVGGKAVQVVEETVTETTFCRLLHFRKVGVKPGPKLLMVAPMSGHYATLLRDTVARFMSDFDVYITDWTDARDVPILCGAFNLDDYIDTLIKFFHVLGTETSVLAVCQPSVPVLAAVSMMAEDNDPCRPKAMVLMGGPIDTRQNPTAVNKLAKDKGLEWFRNNVISFVPPPYGGWGRRVYPGFLQLTGFMTMNLDKHLSAHRDLFEKLVEGCDDSIEKHDDFYNEYNAVMDLTEEFYLQTIDRVFIRECLPNGTFVHRDRLVDPGKITDIALLTVEGERDDISGLGQTEGAHRLCSSLPETMRKHHVQEGAGHYGIFNGRRFSNFVAPMITDFLFEHLPSEKARKAPAKAKEAPKAVKAEKPVKPKLAKAPTTKPVKAAKPKPAAKTAKPNKPKKGKPSKAG